MTRRTEAAYDRWALTYDSDSNPQTTLEFDDVLEILGVTAGSHILDAACGTGRYIEPLLERGADVEGFDFSEQMLAVARRRYPHICLTQGDLAEPLPYAAGVFSHVLCAQALKHLPSLSSAFAEIARVLRPGGRFVFSVTHPEMDFSDYELSFVPGFVLSREADIYHHAERDYRSSLAAADLVLDEWRAIPVAERIEHLLTPLSFSRVRGRAQVAVVRATRPIL